MLYRILENGNSFCWVQRRVGPVWLYVRRRSRRLVFEEYTEALLFLERIIRGRVKSIIYYVENMGDIEAAREKLKEE